MEQKLKPINCEKCPVVILSKGEISCGCMKKLTAKIDKPQEKQKMWENCPLDWDENKK